jgi:hypothetical protein
VEFRDRIKPHLDQNSFEVIHVYDWGVDGDNEVSLIRLASGEEVLLKVMVYFERHPQHHCRKAMCEVAWSAIDQVLGGGEQRVSPDIYVEFFQNPTDYARHWGHKNPEGKIRVCQVARSHCPGVSGEEWRGAMYSLVRHRLGQNLQVTDEHIRGIIEVHPDAERMSLIDLATINQDRSARNWGCNWEIVEDDPFNPDHFRFYGFDNGMAWFHQFPLTGWETGCAIDDVIFQVGDWRFISGVFSTLWGGRKLSDDLRERLTNFDIIRFLDIIEREAREIGFPVGMSQDWRFEGIIRRLRWMAKQGRQPTREEYQGWFDGSKDGQLMNPHCIRETGGENIWYQEFDEYCHGQD